MRRLIGSLGVILGMCIPFLGHGQSIQGKVLHKFTQKSLKNVRVLVVEQDRSFHTDKDGNFRIEDLNVGLNWIEISHPGFRTVRKELFFKKDFTHQSWEIHLCPSPGTQFDTHTEIGQRIDASPLSSGFFSQSFGEAESREYASRNMGEALLKIPGLWIRELGAAQNSPVIRGLSGDRTSTLLDGIRINNSFMGPESPSLLGSIDPYQMESAEALFGSASTQYGSDAMGGLIKLTSKSPDFSEERTEIHGNVMMRLLGKSSEQSGAGSLQINSANLGLMASYSLRNLGGIIPGTFGKDYQQESALIKGKLKVARNHILNLSYQKYGQRNVLSRETQRLPEELRDNLRPIQWQMAHAKWVSNFQNRWLKQLRVTGAYQQYDENREMVFSNDNLFRKEENQSQTMTGIIEVHSQPNLYWNFVSGVEIYQEGISSQAYQSRSGSGDLRIASPRFLNGSQVGNMDIYSLHTVELVKLRLSFGGRAHKTLLTGNDPTFGEVKANPHAFSGNISAVYPLTQHIFLSSSFNTGFRNPGVHEISSLGNQSTQFELPTDSLGVEKSFSSQIGLKAKTESFVGSLVLYRTRLNDLIDFIPGTYLNNSVYEGRTVVQKSNTGQAYIKGIEASVEIPISTAMALYGSILYTSGENLKDQSSLSRIPPVNGRLGFRMRTKIGVWSRIEWQKAGTQNALSQDDINNPYIDPRGTASWNVLNLHVGYDFNWGYMTLGVQNFFDNTYRIHGSHVDGIDRVVLLSMQLGF